jgi:hypothetical protein
MTPHTRERERGRERECPMKTKATHLKLSLSEKMCEKFILGRFLACLIRERERERVLSYTKCFEIIT